MPRINISRIINAKFNDGNGMYDDFTMEFGGNSAVFELPNGGGKTVQILLLLQCVIPNSYLDYKKPLKYMFMGGDENRTTHVLIEWNLDEGVHDHNYMLTGFCARKRTDTNDEVGNDEIKYFNYIILYDEPNEYDIHKIPLCEKNSNGELKSAKSYSDTYSMLKDLERSRDPRYRVWVFDKKGEYQESIKKFNLIESEFDLIRQINQRENYLKDFFRAFVSSKKLVQDLLIKIIDNCLRDKHHISGHNGEMLNSEDIAISVYRFRENLRKLQNVQKHFKDYEKLQIETEKLVNANKKVIEVYQSYEDLVYAAASQYISHEVATQRAEKDLQISEDRFRDLESQQKKNGLKVEQIKLKKMEADVNNGRISLKQLEMRKNEVFNLLGSLEKRLKFAYAADKYVLINSLKNEIYSNREVLEAIKKEKHIVYDERDRAGNILHCRYLKRLNEVRSQLKSEMSKRDSIKQEFDTVTEEHGGKKDRLNNHKDSADKLEGDLESLRKEIFNLHECHKSYSRITDNFFDTNEELNASKKHYEHLDKECLEIREENIKLNVEKPSYIKESEILKERVAEINLEIKKINEDIEKYVSEKRNVMELVARYNATTIESCRTNIEKYEISTIREQMRFVGDSEKLRRRLKAVEDFGYDVLNEDLMSICSVMGEKYDFAICGMDHLKRIPDEKREETLNRAPWLPKSILVGRDDFRAITDNPSKLPVYVKDSSVIISSIEYLNPDKKEISLGDVFVPYRESEHYIDNLDGDKAKTNLENKLSRIESEIKKYEMQLDTIRKHKSTVESFILQYVKGREQDYDYEIKTCLSEKETLKKSLDVKFLDIQSRIKVIEEKIAQNNLDLNRIHREANKLHEKIDILEKLSAFEKEMDDKQEGLKVHRLEMDKLSKELALLKDRQSQLDTKLIEKDGIVKQLDKQIDKIERILKSLGVYGDKRDDLTFDPLSKLETDDLCSKFKALDERIKNTDINVREKEQSIRSKQSYIDLYKKEIVEQHEISWEYIEAKNPQQTCPEEYKNRLRDQIKEIKNNFSQLNEEYNESKAKQIAKEDRFSEKTNEYNLISSEKYSLNPNFTDASQFNEELANLRNESRRLLSEIENLKRLNQEKRDILLAYKNEYELYKQLKYEYQFENMDVDVSDVLKPFEQVSKELGKSKKEIEKWKEGFNTAVNDFIEKTNDLEVDIDYTSNIRPKFPIPHSLREANSTAKNLEEYSERLSTDMAIIKEELEGLKEDERILIDRIMRFTEIYKGHLKDFPDQSKINIGGNSYKKLVHIDFERYEYPEEQATNNIRMYIQDLLNDEKVDEKKIISRMTPKELLNKVLDMDAIKVQIRKIDKHSHKFQDWDKINASDGQENAMYIIFLAALLSYIREIVVNRSDKDTSKVLIIDNPFGSTGAPYLWEKIWSIMERNNIQLICPGHSIDPMIRALFPVSYLLTEDISVEGRTKVVVKEANMNGASIERAIQLRTGQMTLPDIYD